MKTVIKRKRVQPILPRSFMDDLVGDLSGVLGSDSVHKASDSDQGEPRMFIDSGVPELNFVLDRRGRGWPVGRIIEVYGGEACIPANTYLSTGYGLLTVEEFFNEAGLKASCTSRKTECKHPLLNRYGIIEDTELFINNNKRPVVTIEVSDGTKIQSTDNHPHLILDKTGNFSWRKTSNLDIGDYLIRSKKMSFGKENLITRDVAYLLGVLVADGYFGEQKIALTNDHPYIQDIMRTICKKETGKIAKEYPVNDSVDFQFAYKEGIEKFYSEYGLKRGVAKDKVVPLVIRKSIRAIVREFICGYMDCEGSYDPDVGNFQVSSASRELLNQVKLMLQGFNIHASLNPKPVAAYPKNDYWYLNISGKDAKRYLEVIGTRLRDWVYDKEFGYHNGKTFPEFIRPLVQSLYDATETDRKHHELLKDIKQGHSLSSGALKHALTSVAWGNEKLRRHLLELCEYEFVQVTKLHKESEPIPTFDFCMPLTHSFIVEGLITHNSCKTGIGYELVKQVQRAGGDAILYPAEGNYDRWLARQYGIDLKRLIIGDDETVEGIFTSYNRAINRVGRLGLLVGMIDSVAGMATKAELDDLEDGKEIKRDRSAQVKALMISSALRKLGAKIPRTNSILFLVNQIRDNPDAGMFAKKSKPPGGRAIKFYASVRLELTIMGKYKRVRKGKPYIAGVKLRIMAEKNRLAQPYQEAMVLLDFNKGLLPMPKKKNKQ